MTTSSIVHCDRVHPERTPPGCRAFYVTRATAVPVAYEEAHSAGWSQDVGDVDSCPSCTRGAA